MKDAINALIVLSVIGMGTVALGGLYIIYRLVVFLINLL